MTSGALDPNAACLLDTPLDLVETFGPMAAMHAALEKLGVGMPCGFVARFQDRTAAEVESAVEIARQRFPVLQRGIGWRESRASLVVIDPLRQRQVRASKLPLEFNSEMDGPLWHYRVVQDDADAWLMAVWAHAAADGTSMLRFSETISAVINHLPTPRFEARPPRLANRKAMARWFLRFLIEHHLPYVRPLEKGHLVPGVAWLTVSSERSTRVIERARAECGSFAAWLGAAACMTHCQFQGVSSGRVLLNLPILRDDMDRVGGFGFGMGSMLMPVKLNYGANLPSVARYIFKRLKEMTDQGWDENFERFVGQTPKRHLRFASLRARGFSAPIVNVSWKGSNWRMGGTDGVRDLACFAVAPAAHISAHVDRNGMSLSITSSQPAQLRKTMLLRIADQLGCGSIEDALTCDAYSAGSSKSAFIRPDDIAVTAQIKRSANSAWLAAGPNRA